MVSLDLRDGNVEFRRFNSPSPSKSMLATRSEASMEERAPIGDASKAARNSRASILPESSKSMLLKRSNTD